MARVQHFPSTFNSNLNHYSKTTKALSLHSGARASEWWIFPITLLSVQVSGKHRLADGAFRVLHSCVSLTLALLSNLPHKDPMLKWKGKMQLCSSYIFGYIQKLNYHDLASVCECMYSKVDELIWWPKSSAIIRQSQQKHRNCIGVIDWFSPNNSSCEWHESTCRQQRQDMRNDCFMHWFIILVPVMSQHCTHLNQQKRTEAIKFKEFISVFYINLICQATHLIPLGDFGLHSID